MSESENFENISNSDLYNKKKKTKKNINPDFFKLNSDLIEMVLMENREIYPSFDLIISIFEELQDRLNYDLPEDLIIDRNHYPLYYMNATQYEILNIYKGHTIKDAKFIIILMLSLLNNSSFTLRVNAELKHDLIPLFEKYGYIPTYFGFINKNHIKTKAFNIGELEKNSCDQLEDMFLQTLSPSDNIQMELWRKYLLNNNGFLHNKKLHKIMRQNDLLFNTLYDKSNINKEFYYKPLMNNFGLKKEHFIKKIRNCESDELLLKTLVHDDDDDEIKNNDKLLSKKIKYLRSTILPKAYYMMIYNEILRKKKQ